MNQLTTLIGRIQTGDTAARDALFAAAYAELHRLARARLRQGGRNTVLDTTCLVHESYLRFVQAGELRAEDRRAFFAYASNVMRSVIVNSLRERLAQKRGGDRRPLTLSTNLAANIASRETRFSGCMRRWTTWRRQTLVWPRWHRCATLVGTASRNCRNTGNYRTHGATRLGEGAADPRGGAAVSHQG
ncbi:MAG: ECF-type sigma factor [Steroidobacteraceae bacterium]